MIKRLLIFWIWAGLLNSSAIADTQVIVHPSVVNSSVNSHTLSRIYAMQLKNWNDGQSIKVFVLPSKNQTHRQFTLRKLKLQSHQLDRLWNRLIFTGTGRTPIVVKSELEMIEKVKTTPGGIGYVSGGVDVSGLKVLHEVQSNE